MQQSGTKLVAALVFLSLALGVVSWWYRYEAAHRATSFWGPTAARVISQPDRIEWFRIDDLQLAGQEPTRQYQDVTGEPGMVHLRHNLVSDANYDWDLPIMADTVTWRWGLRLTASDEQVWVLFDEPFETVGRQLEEDGPIDAVSATAMGETLHDYFSRRGLLSASTDD